MTPEPFGSDKAEWKTRWIWKGWSTWHRINCETGNPAIPKHHGWGCVPYRGYTQKNGRLFVGNGDVIRESITWGSTWKPFKQSHSKGPNQQVASPNSAIPGDPWRKQTYWVEEKVEMIHPKSIKKPYGKWKASTPSLNTNDLSGSYCCRSVKQAKRFTKQNFVVSVCVCVREFACMLPIKHSILMQPDYNCKNKPGSCGSQSGLVIRHNSMQRIDDCFWMLGPKCGKADMSCYEQAELKVSSESLYSRKVVTHHCNKCI